MSRPPEVSAVVLSYARPNNLRAICENLASQSFVDQIVVWHQGEQRLTLAMKDALRRLDVEVFYSPNFYTRGRFLAMQFCKHDTIATCDDNQLCFCWQEIYDLYVDEGQRAQLVAALDKGHFGDDGGRRWQDAHMTMLGFGSMLDRRWCTVFGEYVSRYGEDEVFHRKADRLFTIMQDEEHIVFQGDVSPMRGSDGPESLHKLPDHKNLSGEALMRGMICNGYQQFAGEWRRVAEVTT